MRNNLDWYDRLRCHLQGLVLGWLLTTFVLGFLYCKTVIWGYNTVMGEQTEIKETISALKIKEVEALNKAIREYQADLEALFKIPVYDIQNPKTGDLNEK